MDEQKITEIFREVQKETLRAISTLSDYKNYDIIVEMVSTINFSVEEKHTSTIAYVEKVDYYKAGDYENLRQKYVMVFHELGFSEKILKEVCYHEMTHIIADEIKGKQQNHNNFYKNLGVKLFKLPKKVFRASITPPQEILDSKVFRYIIECDNCKYIYRYQNKTKFVKAVISNNKTFTCKCGCNSFHFLQDKED